MAGIADLSWRTWWPHRLGLNKDSVFSDRRRNLLDLSLAMAVPESNNCSSITVDSLLPLICVRVRFLHCTHFDFVYLPLLLAASQGTAVELLSHITVGEAIYSVAVSWFTVVFAREDVDPIVVSMSTGRMVHLLAKTHGG